jgi:alpha-ribazole phosphatase
MELYLVRHSLPEVAPGICYGCCDLAVKPYELQTSIDFLKKNLPSGEACRVFSSPKQRCTALAGAMYDNFTTDVRLQELDFGQWEGCAWDQIDPIKLRAWGDDFVNLAPPQGESFANLAQRVDSFSMSPEFYALPVAVVVTHAGVIRAWVARALGLPLAHAFRLDVAFGGFVHVHWNCDARLNRLIALRAP